MRHSSKVTQSIAMLFSFSVTSSSAGAQSGATQVLRGKTTPLPSDASPSNRRLSAPSAESGTNKIRRNGAAVRIAFNHRASIGTEPPTAQPRGLSAQRGPAPPRPVHPLQAPPRAAAAGGPAPVPIHRAAERRGSERLPGPRAAPCRDRPRIGARRAAERGAPGPARRGPRRSAPFTQRPGPAAARPGALRPPDPPGASHGERRRRLRLALLGAGGGAARPAPGRSGPVWR